MNGWLNLKRLQNAFTRSKILDETLQNLNSDWGQTNNNMTLNPLVINVARKNLFYDYKAKDKLEGNIKSKII
jgi:hypothetical protein